MESCLRIDLFCSLCLLWEVSRHVHGYWISVSSCVVLSRKFKWLYALLALETIIIAYHIYRTLTEVSHVNAVVTARYTIDNFLIFWQSMTLVAYYCGTYLARKHEMVVGASLVSYLSMIQTIYFFLLQAYPIHVFLWIVAGAVSYQSTQIRDTLMYDWFMPPPP
jgi:hypothetical protein